MNRSIFKKEREMWSPSCNVASVGLSDNHSPERQEELRHFCTQNAKKCSPKHLALERERSSCSPATQRLGVSVSLCFAAGGKGRD